MKLVSCSQCSHFICDTIGCGQGIGECRVFNDYMAKHPSIEAIFQALIKLGNRYNDPVFWGGKAVTRKCEKYKKLCNE